MSYRFNFPCGFANPFPFSIKPFRDVFQATPCFKWRSVFRTRMSYRFNFPRGFAKYNVFGPKTMKPHRDINVLYTAYI